MSKCRKHKIVVHATDYFIGQNKATREPTVEVIVSTEEYTLHQLHTPGTGWSFPAWTANCTPTQATFKATHETQKWIVSQAYSLKHFLKYTLKFSLMMIDAIIPSKLIA